MLLSLKEKVKNFCKAHFVLCSLVMFVIGGLSIYFLTENKIHSGSKVEVFSSGDADKNENSSGPAGKIFVDVSGAVKNPGVYEIENGGRVGDAVAMAGGAVDNASFAWVSRNLNLSQKIEDSSKIYIPFEWEFYFPEQYKITKTVNGKYAVSSDGSSSGNNSGSEQNESGKTGDYPGEGTEMSDGGNSDTSESSGVDNSGKVNVNTASSSELDTLPGIGPANAEKIISNRTYKDFAEFESKSGLYKSTLENIKDLIIF